MQNPNFGMGQMEQILLGLKGNVDISIYAKPNFDEFQMEEIRLGLEEDFDVNFYAKEEFDYKQMREIRLGLMTLKKSLKDKLCDDIQALLK